MDDLRQPSHSTEEELKIRATKIWSGLTENERTVLTHIGVLQLQTGHALPENEPHFAESEHDALETLEYRRLLTMMPGPAGWRDVVLSDAGRSVLKHH